MDHFALNIFSFFSCLWGLIIFRECSFPPRLFLLGKDMFFALQGTRERIWTTFCWYLQDAMLPFEDTGEGVISRFKLKIDLWNE